MQFPELGALYVVSEQRLIKQAYSGAGTATGLGSNPGGGSYTPTFRQTGPAIPLNSARGQQILSSGANVLRGRPGNGTQTRGDNPLGEVYNLYRNQDSPRNDSNWNRNVSGNRYTSRDVAAWQARQQAQAGQSPAGRGRTTPLTPVRQAGQGGTAQQQSRTNPGSGATSYGVPRGGSGTASAPASDDGMVDFSGSRRGQTGTIRANLTPEQERYWEANAPGMHATPTVSPARSTGSGSAQPKPEPTYTPVLPPASVPENSWRRQSEPSTGRTSGEMMDSWYAPTQTRSSSTGPSLGSTSQPERRWSTFDYTTPGYSASADRERLRTSPATSDIYGGVSQREQVRELTAGQRQNRDFIRNW